MIILPFKTALLGLKKRGIHIQYVLDIGAYRGDFTETVHSVWSSAIVRQIEADERQRNWLQPDAIIALLGDQAKSDVDFYTLSEDKITTGSSMFKELTTHYNANDTVIVKKSMTTLDLLDQKHNFYGNWREHGLVKIDTQGSELLILSGARQFLTNRQPRFILLECSVKQYNENSPRIFSVMEFMNKLNYTMTDIFDISRTANGELLQTDILFERTT